ncbi:DCL family protein [Streptomyces bathyalis]|uniref:DCL family protein n=1 Tax=Streptomyces bathyalis TaxID=2710756 RepID=A0A7T1T6Z1_9ACTN|nr:DCL family protein [Streptomyces bathyalis]QPP07546.1 DCL family protein [Streptomyces bathyalis]
MGHEHFRTKEAVRDRCRAIRDRYRGQPQVTGENDDHFLRELLSLHPEYEFKKGSGITGFTVIRNELHGTYGFAVLRVDGTTIDFSWNVCLNPPSQLQKVLSCLRRAIKDQVIAHRDAAFMAGPVSCAITGATIAFKQEAHVDHHAPTFLEIAEGFITSHGGPDAFRIADDIPNGFSHAELADKELEAAWQEHHQAVAVLRVVTKSANLSRPREENR